MGKGSRRERQARELYERAGFWVYSPQNPKFGDNDLWNLFDLACFRVTDGTLRFVQVKSNRASGVREWMHVASRFERVDGLSVDFAVCHDRKGWRLLRPTEDGHSVVVDEREIPGVMGDDVVKWLRGGSGVD